MLEQLREILLGKEITLSELDNTMIENDFYSIGDDGVEREVIQEENVVYTSEVHESVIIEFDVTIKAVEENESLFASYIVINSVDAY